IKLIECRFGNHHPIGDHCDMTTQSLPAASLRPAIRLPVARVLLRVSNHLNWMALSAIGAAVSGVASGCLPALREASGRLPQVRSVDAEQLGRPAQWCYRVSRPLS